ncbi:MAG TPA: DUF1080 domain-containing protein [Verrucomicrobiota bacterium]|nr:DUF1080 domain-containing protein [Verrucomicrobiota bacterium]
MKPISLVAVLALCTVTRAATAEIVADLLTTNETHRPRFSRTQPPDVIALWNGRNLEGWSLFFTNAPADADATWSASNGVLTLHADGNPMGYVRTENTFSNYHLHVEWRWLSTATHANSGVLLHIGETDAIWPVSVEAQLKNGAAGELIGMGGGDFSASFINNRKRMKIARSSENPMGQWNAYDIYCRSNTVEAFVNGTRQTFIEQVTVSSGHIGLQLELHDIQFRNVWLKPL